MKQHLAREHRLLQAFLLLIIFFTVFSGEAFAQNGLQIPAPARTVQLFEPESQGLGSLFMDSTLFKIQPPYYTRIVKMDSTGKFVSASEIVDQTEFRSPVIVDLDTYIRMRIAFDRREMMRKAITSAITTHEEKSTGALELEIPVRIKNETFTRIFGSDRVRLRVTGNISFDLSGRSEERSGAKISAVQDRGTFSPRFSQTQQFPARI